jgi:putative hemin transport protein
METTEATRSLKDEWITFHETNPRVRIRDAARQLNVTEAEIVAAFTGGAVLRLTTDFTGLWKRMGELGYVMSLTRNEHCVHERKGKFEKVHVHRGNMRYVAGPDIDLRMFFSHWAFGFAVRQYAEAGFRTSLQIFDHEGTAVVKIFLLEQSDHDAFDRLVEAFRAPDQSGVLALRPVEKRELRDGEVDVESFQRSWASLKDSHDFFPMLNKYKVSRLHAVRIGGPFTRRVSNACAAKLLHDVSASAMPVMVFTGNNGMVQIHTGPVKKIVEIPGWINVMDPEFNLHLRTEPICECWVVRKPNAETDVHSLECYDRDGNLIVQFFGKRKPGIPEDPEWTKYVTSLS